MARAVTPETLGERAFDLELKDRLVVDFKDFFQYFHGAGRGQLLCRRVRANIAVGSAELVSAVRKAIDLFVSEHSLRLKEMLDLYGRSCKWMLLRGERHGFSHSRKARSCYAGRVNFLANQLQDPFFDPRGFCSYAFTRPQWP